MAVRGKPLLHPTFAALALAITLCTGMTAHALPPIGQASPANAWVAQYQRAMDRYDARDFAGAESDFRALADYGSAGAQAMLGELYARGEGVPQSDARAAMWFHKAARRGFAPAQIRLAELLHAGRGLARDDVAAATWLMLAAERGNAEEKQHAAAMLAALQAQLSPAALADAQNRKRNWKPDTSLSE